MVTLSDVAKEANVSKMTVSRAINHPEQATPELLALTGKAMTKLNYHPGSIARALANNRTSVIKFVTLEDIDTTEPYYMNLPSGVARGLKADSYAIQLATDADQIQKGNADGHIITGVCECDYPIFDELKKPFIFFGKTSSSFNFVDTDNRYDTATVTKYALARGYENAVFIGTDVKKGFEYARGYGYSASMRECSLEPQIFRTGNHPYLVKKLIDEQIKRTKPNTYFIRANGHSAVSVCRTLAHLDKKMPEDHGTIGFDGVFLDQVANSQPTTVR